MSLFVARPLAEGPTNQHAPFLVKVDVALINDLSTALVPECRPGYKRMRALKCFIEMRIWAWKKRTIALFVNYIDLRCIHFHTLV